MENNEELRDLDINYILEYHNCEYPCLAIDYIEVLKPGKYCKAVKNFTYNEWYFPAHFRDDPNVPSSIMIEAMSQTLLMTFLTLSGNKKRHTACLKINNVVFKKKVVPGHRLELEAVLNSYRGGLAIGQVKGMVGTELACSADFVMGIPEILSSFAPNRTQKQE